MNLRAFTRIAIVFALASWPSALFAQLSCPDPDNPCCSGASCNVGAECGELCGQTLFCKGIGGTCVLGHRAHMRGR